MATVGCDVVVVEDDQDFSDAVRDVLTDEGYSASAFDTPEDALEWLLAGHRPAVVLLDLHTSGMSAQRFQALLISEGRLRDLPVIIVSGDPRVRAIARTVGASAAFEKPVDLERLLRIVDDCCRHRSSAQGNPSPSAGRAQPGDVAAGAREEIAHLPHERVGRDQRAEARDDHDDVARQRQPGDVVGSTSLDD